MNSCRPKSFPPEKTQEGVASLVSPPMNPHTGVEFPQGHVEHLGKFFGKVEKSQGRVGASVAGLIPGQAAHRGVGNFHTLMWMSLDAKVAISRAHKGVWMSLWASLWSHMSVGNFRTPCGCAELQKP